MGGAVMKELFISMRDYNREKPRSHHSIRWCFYILMMVLVGFTSSEAQVQNSGTGNDPSEQKIPVAIENKLKQLHPDSPQDYFDLGEDMMDIRRFDLSDRLFVIAAHLDGPQLGRSACLALAESARLQRDISKAAHMRAMARLFPAPTGSAEISLDEKQPPEEDFRHAGALVSAMLGFYRTGYGTRGIKVIEQDRNTYQLLSRFERGIGGVADVMTYCKSNTRDDLCENRLYIEKPGVILQNHTASAGDYQVCPHINTYLPQLTPYRLTHLLDVETALAGGRKARWGARLTLDDNIPRPVLNPAFLSRAYAVDPDQCIYRNHQWVRPEDP